MTHAIREALAAFRRAPVLTGLASAMVGFALFVLGLFGLVAWNLQSSLELLEEQVEVVVYLRDDIRAEEIELAVDQLRELDPVQGVDYVSKEQALARAPDLFPEFDRVYTDLEVNPLPASLEVQFRDGARTEENVSVVVEVAGAWDFVDDVRYGEEWVQRLFTLRRVAVITALVLGGAFALVAALIIGTALRIAIFARRDEIYIMRLVGARNGFIRRPFLLEGALAGALGGILALALTWGTYRLAATVVFAGQGDMSERAVAWLPLPWVAGGLAAGVVFGIVASSLAVRRHLREVT